MSNWVERAVQFTHALNRFGPGAVRSAQASAPMTPQELQRFQSTLRRRIPSSLVDFLCTQSASCNCEYYLSFKRKPTQTAIELMGEEDAIEFAKEQIYGGASLCQSEYFADWNSESMISVFDDIDKECAHLWRNSFLFKSIATADFLGLYMAEEVHDPPVVYLDHEAEIHRPIAPSLDHFLREWEKLWYIGPEHWELADYIDEETGYINAESGDLNKLRSRFGDSDD